MSSYSLSNSAPINNIGYYDVPIQNQYSNQHNNRQYRQITNTQFNHHISDNFNTSNDNYEIYQTQTYPSRNLFINNEPANQGYGYSSNNGNYNGALIQNNQHNRQMNTNNQNYTIENFDNNGSEMELEMNANRLDNSKSSKERPIRRPMNIQQQHQPNVVYNNYIPNQPNINYNDYNYNQSPDYLNVGSIPNIAGLYNNNLNRPVEKIIIKEPSNDKHTKITELDSDDDDDDEIEVIDKKKSKNVKKKIDKKKKHKKKKNNMIYLVIFLLVIIIGLMLYIIMNNKVKRVRF